MSGWFLMLYSITSGKSKNDEFHTISAESKQSLHWNWCLQVLGAFLSGTIHHVDAEIVKTMLFFLLENITRIWISYLSPKQPLDVLCIVDWSFIIVRIIQESATCFCASLEWEGKFIAAIILLSISSLVSI